MPELAVPIPGSVRARLLDAGIARFSEHGYSTASVVDIAGDADVTTGALYHHFRNKAGLFAVIRDEMETRMTERMDGAAAAVGGTGRPAVRAALEVSFDAAVRMRVTRILAEPRPDRTRDPVALLLGGLLPRSGRQAGPMLAAVWRAALLTVADGVPPARARAGLHWVLDVDAAS